MCLFEGNMVDGLGIEVLFTELREDLVPRKGDSWDGAVTDF